MIDGELRGYKHVSQFHEGVWAMDLVNSMRSKAVEFANDCLLLRPDTSSWEGFPRDACALCENIFFARGCGLAIDAEVLEILRQTQPGVDSMPTPCSVALAAGSTGCRDAGSQLRALSQMASSPASRRHSSSNRQSQASD
jgi:hypothetical protein